MERRPPPRCRIAAKVGDTKREADEAARFSYHVERWFGLITERMTRRGTSRSVKELEHAIYQWLANWNENPKPFVWRATADVILDKVRRCKELSGTPH
jgi:hypothetical protein